MEPNNYPPPDSYAHLQTRETLPVGPKRTRTIVAIVVASVLGFAVIAGLAVAAVLAAIDRTRDEAEEARQFTSSDGTFTMTLPAGWADETEAYRAAVLERNGAESTIEGLVTVDGLPHAFSANFVSMSGHPVGPMPESPEQIGQGLVDDWRDNFDDYTELAPATFMTDAGDSVWHGGLRGTTDGEEWMIIIAVVVGDGSLALFDLELRPPFYDASDALLESLKSLVFAPTANPDDVAQNFAPESDGRTYSSERGASIIIPSAWTRLPVDADVSAFDPEIPFDFLGFWQVAPGSPAVAPTLSMVVGDRIEPTLSARDQLVAQFGEIDSVTVDEAGVTYTVLALEPWSVPGTADAAWIDLAEDRGTTGIEAFEGVVRARRCYILTSALEQLVACLDVEPSDLESATLAVEPALLTVEFAE